MKEFTHATLSCHVCSEHWGLKRLTVNAPITFQFEIRIGKGVHGDRLAEAAKHINNKVNANVSSTSRHPDAVQANKK